MKEEFGVGGETRQILSKNSHPSVTDGCECFLRFEFATFLGKYRTEADKGCGILCQRGPAQAPEARGAPAARQFGRAVGRAGGGHEPQRRV